MNEEEQITNLETVKKVEQDIKSLDEIHIVFTQAEVLNLITMLTKEYNDSEDLLEKVLEATR